MAKNTGATYKGTQKQKAVDKKGKFLREKTMSKLKTKKKGR